jgi:hypothetical protein
MACETRLKQRQTLAERKAEVKKVIYDVNSLIAAGRVKPVIDKLTGAIAFQGFDENLRDGVTDACVYRQLMISGSSLTKAKIAQAEQIAGRGVNRQALGAGIHSHDGGQTFGPGHRH